MRAVLLVASLLQLLVHRAVATSGAHGWEWSGVFDFPAAGHYTWSAVRGADGAYKEPTMRLVVLSAGAATSAALEGLEGEAERLWQSAGVAAGPGAHMDPGFAYNLTFDQGSWATHFQVRVASPGPLAFFAEHLPTEFERGFHYLRSETGADIEPSAEESAAGHSHGHTPHCPWTQDWEWAGLFNMQAGLYDWNAERRAGAYADPRMKLLLLPAANGSAEALEALEHDAHTRWEQSWTQAPAGSTLQIGGAYDLIFNAHSWVSHFRMNVSAPGHVALFAQHLPTEFESNFHYLRTSRGADVEPVLQESVSSCSSTSGSSQASSKDKWGSVVAASMLTIAPTLVGIFLVAFALARKFRDAMDSLAPLASSFASGVLAAAAAFLMLPEGLHLAGAGHDEVTGTWTWGTFLLLGWFLGLLVEHFCQILFPDADKADEEQAIEGSKSRRSAVSIGGPVLLGDFFHNLADGIVIGAAFASCDASFAWKLTGVTVLHELPQEIADFCVLVTAAGMKWYWALLANFVSGLSTLVGGLAAYGSNIIGSNDQGRILAFGAGVYLYVAMTQLGGYVTQLRAKTRREAALGSCARILCFVVGAVLIGLVLLDHAHCDAGGAGDAAGSDAHAGHHH